MASDLKIADDADLAFEHGADLLKDAIELARSRCTGQRLRNLTSADERDLAEALLGVRKLVRSAVDIVDSDGPVSRSWLQRTRRRLPWTA